MRIRVLIRVVGVLVGLAWLVSMLLVVRWHLGAEAALKMTGAALLATAGIALFIGWIWFFEGRARSILQEWAAVHRYDILECKSPFHSGGFSFWSTSRGQVVYFVRLRDMEGHERSAWVRCGNFGGGVLFSHDIEVTWSDHETSTS